MNRPWTRHAEQQWRILTSYHNSRIKPTHCFHHSVPVVCTRWTWQYSSYRRLPTWLRYTVLHQCNVINVDLHVLANCCVWNYTPVETVNNLGVRFGIRIFSFPYIKSLCIYVKYTSNMVVLFMHNAVTSPHLMYSPPWRALSLFTVWTTLPSTDTNRHR